MPRTLDTLQLSLEGSLDHSASILGPEFLADDHKSVNTPLQESLEILSSVTRLVDRYPYCLPLYIILAKHYRYSGYPDLAAGAAYKALLLSDAVQDESDEYHEQAVEAVSSVLAALSSLNSDLPSTAGAHVEGACDEDEHPDGTSQITNMVITSYLPMIYALLIESLTSCSCYKSASTYSTQARNRYPDHVGLRRALDRLQYEVEKHVQPNPSDPFSWPDEGLVRREQYPWNSLEPDRFEELPSINAMMSRVAPKLEILAVELPALTESSSGTDDSRTSKQLGVFAKEDMTPGEFVLNETSLLTANNKLQDALCDACSADLPEIGCSNFDQSVSCAECEVVFCSQKCHDNAQEIYHPALCDKDVESIARDVPATEAAEALYSLLLLRSLAMADTQQCHPLELQEIKYIWADFHGLPLDDHWKPFNDNQSAFCGLPQTLPFSFEHNIRLPFHMLEKMDIDIFRNPQYDVWVFNTLYAKFRGTASARLSGLGGRAIRGPEVSAVHPMWCMANHSCDPNVSWEWGGSIKFWVREDRPEWNKEGERVKKSKAGIRKGEEVFNHYCDVELGVKDRREWARGALGGDCRCSRCMWEAKKAA